MMIHSTKKNALNSKESRLSQTFPSLSLIYDKVMTTLEIEIVVFGSFTVGNGSDSISVGYGALICFCC